MYCTDGMGERGGIELGEWPRWVAWMRRGGIGLSEWMRWKGMDEYESDDGDANALEDGFHE